MADFKKVKNILHLVIWIFSVVAGGLLAGNPVEATPSQIFSVVAGGLLADNSPIESHVILNQFVDAVVLGEIFITTILFAMLFFEEEVPEKTFYLLTIGAAVLYLIAGALLVFHNTDTNSNNNRGLLVLISGILSLGIGAIFLFEFIASLVKKEMLD